MHADDALVDALVAANRIAEAVDICRRIVEMHPISATAHVRLGSLLGQLGQAEAAAACFRRAVELDADLAVAHRNLGISLRDLKRYDAAIDAFRHAITLAPFDPALQYNLGVVLGQLGRHSEQETCLREALRLRPDFPEAYNDLGNINLALGRQAEAMACFREAIRLKPEYADAHTNLGFVLSRCGRHEEAISSHLEAIHLSPTHANAHLNLSHAYLELGNFKSGWAEYEWRWKTDQSAPQDFGKPKWAGDDLTGRTILIYTEQGIGDALQFIRYAWLVTGVAGRVILRVPRSLFRLVAFGDHPFEVIASGDPLPAFDCCVALLSLPGLLGTTLETIPANVPYLATDASLVAHWCEKITGSNGLKVGFAWAGGRKHRNDSDRSMQLERMQPLFELSGVHWFSLQVGERASDLTQLHAGTAADLSADLTDFAETAAAMRNLDLIITVDTAVAHLAGALGRPVWTMLPYFADWRWLRDRSDTPWYPTMRLFRQPRPHDWDTVIADVRRQLELITQGLGVPSNPGMVDAHCNLAATLLESDRLDEAALGYRRALALLPNDLAAMSGLALTLLRQGDLSGAADWYRRVIALQPDSADAHFNLGNILSVQNRLADAVASYQKAIAIAPDFAMAHNNLGIVLGMVGRPQQATDRKAK